MVINKFSTLESRIQALIEIITTLNANNQIKVDLRDIGLKNPIVNKEDNLELDFSDNVDEAVEPSAENTENE